MGTIFIKEKLSFNEAQINKLSLDLFVQKQKTKSLEHYAILESDRKEQSVLSRKLKQRIVIQALRIIFKEYPKTPKTLGAVLLKFDNLKNKKIIDEKTGANCKIYTRNDQLYIHVDGRKKPFEYKKRSLQPFINTFK